MSLIGIVIALAAGVVLLVLMQGIRHELKVRKTNATIADALASLARGHRDGMAVLDAWRYPVRFGCFQEYSVAISFGPNGKYDGFGSHSDDIVRLGSATDIVTVSARLASASPRFTNYCRHVADSPPLARTRTCQKLAPSLTAVFSEQRVDSPILH